MPLLGALASRGLISRHRISDRRRAPTRSLGVKWRQGWFGLKTVFQVELGLVLRLQDVGILARRLPWIRMSERSILRNTRL